MYFLERLPARMAATGNELVIEVLESMAESTDMGVTWRTRPKCVSAAQRWR